MDVMCDAIKEFLYWLVFGFGISKEYSHILFAFVSLKRMFNKQLTLLLIISPSNEIEYIRRCIR